jgi:hypothetical protein
MSAKSMLRGRKWRDLTPVQRSVFAVAVTIQFALAGVAYADLARRPANAVRGPKWIWAPVIAINFVGPIVYLRFGRITATGG